MTVAIILNFIVFPLLWLLKGIYETFGFIGAAVTVLGTIGVLYVWGSRRRHLQVSTVEHREEARMMGVRKKWEAVLRAIHPPCTHCPYRLRPAKFVQSPCLAC